MEREMPGMKNAEEGQAQMRLWRRRALLAATVFSLLAIALAAADGSVDHLLRGWALGVMLLFGFVGGALALLMLHHCTGGRWGSILARPFGAMSRSWPLLLVYWSVLALGMKWLYLWARVTDVAAALKSGWIDAAQVHAIVWKRPLLQPAVFIGVSLVCFALWGFYAERIAALERRRARDGGDERAWKRRFENLCAPGLIVYVLTATAAAILWMLSMDVSWHSSVYGLLFLAGQGYQSFALGILFVLALAAREPYRSRLRPDLLHDLGKWAFAFVMLYGYLAFSQFLILWSGNLPEEAAWYLNRTRGGWEIFFAVEFVLGWLAPFVLLLSREGKRRARPLAAVCIAMLAARWLDLVWLIEPNFPDAARRLHFSWGLLEYVAVPAAMMALWLAVVSTDLMRQPFEGDSRRKKILEAEDE